MIGNGCPYADSKVLIKRVREHLLPTAQLRGLWRPGSTVATPGAGDRHIDLLCYLTPGQAFVTEVQDLCCTGGMSGRTAATHCDASFLQLLTDVLQ